jgi:hypothetical protein
MALHIHSAQKDHILSEKKMTIVFEGMFFFITAQVTKILKHKSYSEDDSVVCLWDMYS